MKMKEYEIVEHICLYGEDPRYFSQTEEKLNANIEQFFIDKKITDEDSKAIFRSALTLQYYARIPQAFAEQYSNAAWSNNNSFDVLVGTYSDRHHHHHHYYYHHPDHHRHEQNKKGKKHKNDDDAKLILAAIALCCAALAAVYGMANDLEEITEELYNRQRVTANLATLALTAAFVVGAAVIVAGLLASNPVGWGVGGTLILIVGVALLLKASRIVANTIDAAMSEHSGLATDSRFQLTDRELKKLENDGFSSEAIAKVKSMIRVLAADASKLSQTGFFATNSEYKKIIKTLTDVKNGKISPDIRKQYGFNNDDFPVKNEHLDSSSDDSDSSLSVP